MRHLSVWVIEFFKLVGRRRRLRRTGLAAMVTIYGARSTAEAMIARIRRIHDTVAGTTPSGEAYCANDPELLNWVHSTAAYGFLRAYHAFVRPLLRLFHATAGRLECSDIVFEFLAIMRSAPILPLLLRLWVRCLAMAFIL